MEFEHVEETSMIFHLDGLPCLGESQTLDMAVRRDSLSLHSAFHFLDLHSVTIFFTLEKTA